MVKDMKNTCGVYATGVWNKECIKMYKSVE